MSAGGEDKNIKKIELKGDIATEMGALPTEGGGTRRRRQGSSRTQKVLRVGTVEKEGQVAAKEGGGSTSTGTLVQLTASHVPGTPGAPEPVGRNSALTQKGATLGGGDKPPTPTTPPAKPVKVVLAPKAKKAKVVLAAGKPAVAAAAAALSAIKGGAAVSHAHKTRKARKIRVSMRGLSKKIHRARTIRQKATETTFEQIKKDLQKAGLIKADSKAPETIIRQMYADYMTLKTRAL
jgi:hypothetical protein